MRLYKEVCLRFIEGALSVTHQATFDLDADIPQAKGKAPVQTVNNQSAPWTGQQGYLSHAFGEAKNLYNQNKEGVPFFPGQTYAPQSPQTLQALQMIEQRATQGSPIAQAGNEQMLGTLRGDYFNNPYLTNAIKAEFNNILPTLQSQAARTGNIHSSAAKLAQGRELGNIIDRRMAEQYNAERSRQHEAASRAPFYAEQQYNDLNRLLGVGGMREAEQQKAIEEARARHEHRYASPQEQLARYINLINGNYGTQGSTQTTGFKGNPMAGALGGALGGGSLASSAALAGAPLGPMGIAGGAALGGLLGSFV